MIIFNGDPTRASPCTPRLPISKPRGGDTPTKGLTPMKVMVFPGAYLGI